jgi:hypothetical protein
MTHDELTKVVTQAIWRELSPPFDSVKYRRELVHTAINIVLEEAAKMIDNKGPRPCDCTACYCGKPEDAAAVAAWDTTANEVAVIRAMKE